MYLIHKRIAALLFLLFYSLAQAFGNEPVQTVYYNTKGEFLFKSPRNHGYDFVKGKAIVFNYNFESKKCSNYAVINNKGQIISENYEYLYDNKNGTFTYKQTIALFGEETTLKGLLNDDLKPITLPKFDDIFLFRDGLAEAKIGNRVGSINAKGEWVVKPRFNDVGYHVNGCVLALLNGYLIKMNSNGQLLDSMQTSQSSAPYLMNNGLIFIKENNLYGLVDQNFKKIAECQHQNFRAHSKGVWLKKDDKWGMISPNGKQIFPFEYDEVKVHSNEFIALMKELNGQKRWKILNADLSQETDLKFADVDGFRDGMCGVSALNEESDEVWGFLNENLIEVVPLQYESVGFYENGVAPVSVGGGDADVLFIDKNAQPILGEKFHYGNSYQESYLLAVSTSYEEGWRWGLITRDGRQVLPMIFKDWPTFSETDDIIRCQLPLNEKQNATSNAASELVEQPNAQVSNGVYFKTLANQFDIEFKKKGYERVLERSSFVSGQNITSQYLQTWQGEDYSVLVIIEPDYKKDIGLIQDYYKLKVEPGNYVKINSKAVRLDLMNFSATTTKSIEFKITNESSNKVDYLFVVYKKKA
ncbi:MAG: WG repeat-containing protein [Bacteroidetes bacterium]|nr:WG repeat-containing protein [Bacteroidota bacterium]